MVFSLTDICSNYVAIYAFQYRISDFEGLPHPVLTGLPQFLCPFQLNRLYSIFEIAGVDTKKIWKKHFANRWSFSHQKTATIFKDDDAENVLVDPRHVYLERHFQFLLGKIAMELVDRDNPELQAMHVRMSPVWNDSHCCGEMKEEISLDSLQLYAPYVRVLTIMASVGMARVIMSSSCLMEVLASSVKRLRLYFLSDKTYDDCKNLLAYLVQQGRLNEFALFSGRLSPLKLFEILWTAAGSRIDCSFFSNVEKSDENVTTEPIVDFLDDSTFELSDDSSDGPIVVQFPVDGTNTDAAQDLFSASLCIAAGSDKMSDLFDIALESSSALNSDVCLSSPSVEEVRLSTYRALGESLMTTIQDRQDVFGCESLTLAYLPFEDALQDVLWSLLPHWNGLKKLALLELKIESIHGAGFTDFLAKSIRSCQLSHLLLYETKISGVNFLDVLILSLLDIVRQNQPLQELSLSFLNHQSLTRLSNDVIDKLENQPFHGTVILDLSHTYVSGYPPLFPIFWIKHDLALRHLYLSAIQNDVDDFLDAILVNGKIETLHLDGVAILQHNHTKLLSILQTMPSLRSLNLDNCSLSSEFVGCDSFISAVKNSGLTDLHLASNRLGEVGCLVLKTICSERQSTRFRFLDLRYNRIKGNSLLKVANEIFSEFKSSGKLGSLITKLDLDGNLIGRYRRDITESFSHFIDFFSATDVDYDAAFADHASQM